LEGWWNSFIRDQAHGRSHTTSGHRKSAGNASARICPKPFCLFWANPGATALRHRKSGFDIQTTRMYRIMHRWTTSNTDWDQFPDTGTGFQGFAACRRRAAVQSSSYYAQFLMYASFQLVPSTETAPEVLCTSSESRGFADRLARPSVSRALSKRTDAERPHLALRCMATHGPRSRLLSQEAVHRAVVRCRETLKVVFLTRAAAATNRPRARPAQLEHSSRVPTATSDGRPAKGDRAPAARRTGVGSRARQRE
jgi:hypothetical protein